MRRWSTWSSAPRSLEVELAATLIYSASHHPYRQIRDLVADLPEARVTRSSSLGLRHRGRTTKPCAPSTPAQPCASTSSWTSAASATCTAIAAARRSSRDSPPCTATRLPARRPGRRTYIDIWPKPALSGRLPGSPLKPRTSASAQIAQPGARGRAVRPLPASRWPRAFAPVQDGFRRSAVHQRAALRAPPATSAIAAWPGRCIWPSSASTHACRPHPRNRLHKAHRSAAAVNIWSDTLVHDSRITRDWLLCTSGLTG
jgi:hypothetical protein